MQRKYKSGNRTGLLCALLIACLLATPLTINAEEVTDTQMQEENSEITISAENSDSEISQERQEHPTTDALWQDDNTSLPDAEPQAEERNLFTNDALQERQGAETTASELFIEEAAADEAADEAGGPTEEESAWETGVYEEDGRYQYYENGIRSDKTGVAKRKGDGLWVYVENGIFKKATGVAKRLSDGKYVYVKNGIFKKSTGVAKRLSDGKYVYVKNGIFKKSTGLAKRLSDGKWLYMKKGVFFKGHGHTIAIGNDSRILYYAKGVRIKSKKSFTGVYREKCYKKNKKVAAFKKDDWLKFLADAGKKSSLTVTNGKLSASKLAKLKKEMNRYAAKTNSFGFIALNTKTGMVISYHADLRLFGASTIKAPYIAALCKYNAARVTAKKKTIRKTLQRSSNGGYMSLFRAYGARPIYRLMREADVKGRVGSTGYRNTTPRELAKMWGVMKDYMDHETAHVKLLQSSLLTHKEKGKITDYYKKGWMEPETWSGGILNCAGSGQDWVYGMVSSYSRSIPESAQDKLIATIYSVIR